MTDNKLSLDGIAAILFDLDGTLRHSRPSYDHAFFDVAVRFGVLGSGEQRRQAQRWVHYYWAGSPEVTEDSQAFENDWSALLTNYLRRYLIVYGCGSDQAGTLAPKIYDLLEQEHQAEDWVDPSTPETLDMLKEAGFTLGVVSNRHQPFQDTLEVLELGTFFEFTLAAGEVDSWKPDGLIFEHAVQRAGSCPDCTMYVGDNYYADIVGARRAGLQPVLLDPEDLFPDAGCPVIRSLGEFQKSLAQWQK